MAAWMRRLVARMRGLFGGGRGDMERAREIAAHLGMLEEEFRAKGMTEEESRRQARLRLGNAVVIREEAREMSGVPFVENLWRDVGYALRQMRKNKGFAATAVLILALGIGASAAMFTVVDHVLLQPIPYRDADQLVQIQEVDTSGKDTWPQPWLDIQQWRQQSRSFAEIAFSSDTSGGRNFLVSRGAALQVNAQAVSANLFPMLGVQPMLGRGFLPGTPSFAGDRNAGTVVLSYAVWKEALGGKRNILGKTVQIDDTPRTVIGVMPPGFRYPAEAQNMAQVWTPIELGKNDQVRSVVANSYAVVGRLRPGVTVEAAQAEMTAIQKRVAQEWPNTQQRNNHSGVLVQRYSDTLVQADVRKALLALLAAAGVLWLIASLNVTNLLLARATARQREIAMRGALGASRWRVAQEMMVEGLVMSTAAALLGGGLAFASVKLLAHELHSNLPLPVPARPDTWILTALMGMTVVSALVSTAWPALLAARAPIEPALRQSGMQAGTGRKQHRLRGTLVAVEVALSLTLLVVCGLLLRTIYTLRHVPLGFRTDHILVADLDVPTYRYAHRNLAAELYEPLLKRVQHLHGVESAGLMTEVPLENTFAVEMRMSLKARHIYARLKAASPDVQKVFGFPMAAGRFFNADDTATSLPVMVVNETFARMVSPDQHNPDAVLGTKLMGNGANKWAEIVGILADEHQSSIAQPSQPEIEFCIPQVTPDSIYYNVLDERAMDLAVRTREPEAEMIPQLRDILGKASPELATAKITTMDQIVEDSYGSQRLAAHLLEIFGGSALLLCIAGLYGLLAYVVTQRTREMGLRIALGAQRGDLLWLVLRQAAVMLMVGVALGIGLALASARVVQGFLYGVKAHDVWTLAGASVVLLASGLIAAYLPARRAASVDPMQALRAE